MFIAPSVDAAGAGACLADPKVVSKALARARASRAPLSVRVSVCTRDAPDRLREERVSLGALQLPLQRRERLDELGRLERTVPTSYRHLLEYAFLLQPVDRLARRLERPSDQV